MGSGDSFLYSKGPLCRAGKSLFLMLVLRMHGAISLLSSMPSWCAQGPLTLVFMAMARLSIAENCLILLKKMYLFLILLCVPVFSVGGHS
jgi:hypothetical protein